MFWDYLYHDCDHSGIWHVDLEIAQIYIGQDMKVDLKKALELFNDKEIRVIELNSGTKWFLAPFVGFQYGELRDNNKAHISVIKNLDKHNLLEYVDVGYDTALNNNIKGEKRLQIFKDFNYECVYCEEVFDISELQPDHVLSLKKGGDNSKSNIVCSCRTCNRNKSDKDVFEFIKEFKLNKNEILVKFNLRGIQAPKKGAKDKDKAKDMDKVKDKDSDSRKTSLPKDFCISSRVKKWAEEKGHASLDEHLEYFKSKCKAKGYKYIDWDSAFEGAVRDNWAKLTNEPKPPDPREF